MLDDIQRNVFAAPPVLDIPPKTIEGLVMAIYHLLHVKDGLEATDDNSQIESAIWQLERALGRLGLRIDYFDKINFWRAREIKEGGDTDFLRVE
jgi:hypothetical protein